MYFSSLLTISILKCAVLLFIFLAESSSLPFSSNNKVYLGKNLFHFDASRSIMHYIRPTSGGIGFVYRSDCYTREVNLCNNVLMYSLLASVVGSYWMVCQGCMPGLAPVIFVGLALLLVPPDLPALLFYSSANSSMPDRKLSRSNDL